MRFRSMASKCLALVVFAAPAAHADEALARASGCLECHGVSAHGMGPSFTAVAERYRTSDQARPRLLASVRNGSKGAWIEVSRGAPMPGQSARLSEAQTERLVDWILAR
jgi:cytochrome c551/c552